MTAKKRFPELDNIIPTNIGDDKEERMLKEEKHYWVTPPELYKILDGEFHFDFDPCPNPRPEGFDGLNVEWGNSNWVNPPYRKYEGKGLCAWVRKGIEQHKKGRTVVVVFPITQALGELAEYGIEIRNLGRVRWLSIEDNLPTTKPDTMGLFILKGKGASK